jgi:rhodanese-related sulfurtransferase
MTASILPERLADLDKTGEPVELIDVRTPAEFAEVHVPFARNIPLDRLQAEAFVAQWNGSISGPFYVICQSGTRARKACEKLKAAGLNAIHIDGGTSAWVAAGLPVVRGRKTMSLERQVRIAAGSLVFTGAVLGYFIHPYWIGLAAFVGAGLVFSGITDTCGMGMLLARLPWNQAAAENCQANDTACCK